MKATVCLYTFRSKLYKTEIRCQRMVKRHVTLFFGFLFLMVIVLGALQSQIFGSVTGASITIVDDGSSSNSGDVQVQEVIAYREGDFVRLDVLVSSALSETRMVRIAYLLSSEGVPLSEGDTEMVLEPLRVTPYRFVISSRDSLESMQAVVSVSDGQHLAYRSVRVLPARSLFTGAVIGLEQKSAATLGLILVVLFVCGYGVWFVIQRRSYGFLARETRSHLRMSSGLR